jgi:hypothetical protein
VCISNTRSASNESRIDSEKFRENRRNSDPGARCAQRQESNKLLRTSAEECQVGEKYFILKEILRTELFEIPRMKGVRGRSKYFQGINLKRDSTIHKF